MLRTLRSGPWRLPILHLLWLPGCTPDLPDTARDTGPDTGQLPPDPVDVAIVGGGVAGLAAALEASRAGATVAVLERETTFGGVAGLTGGLLLFSGSPEQAEAGIVDSPEALLLDWQAATGGDPDDPWVRAFAERNVPDVHDWLEDLGIPFVLVPEATGNLTDLPRLHTPSTLSGQALVDGLLGALDPAILHAGTTVTALSPAADGTTRLTCTDASTGIDTFLPARRVVVATGGFLRDLTRVRALVPSAAEEDLGYACGWSADGNGHTLLEGQGATWQNGGAVGFYFHGTADPRATSPGEEVLVAGLSDGIWVDARGERFTDENGSNDFASAEAALAGQGPFWFVFDAITAPHVAFPDPMRLPWESATDPTLDDLLAAGTARQADTLEDLADALPVPPEALRATVDAYNRFTAGEAPDPWRDPSLPAPPIATPPFTAVRVILSVAKAFGGIDVDGDGHVLDATGQPIPGLLAAGELAGMAGGSLVGDRGFNGSFSAVILGGRVAGATAAREALSGR